MKDRTLIRCAGAALAIAIVLALRPHAEAQTASDAAALAVPISGNIIITDMGPIEAHSVPMLIASSGTTTQREDINIIIPVLGLLLAGQASLTMETRMTIVLISAQTVAHGKAPQVVLRGPAGDANVSVAIDEPMQRAGGFDPADAVVHIRGTGGTGMFAGVRIQADLKGAFKPSGTLYLGYPSPDASLAAVQHGLAENSALNDADRAALLEQARQALTKAGMDLFPMEQTAPVVAHGGPPPTQAIITSTLRRAAAHTQVLLTIVVPQGAARQPVRLVVVHQNGTQQTTDLGTHGPGDTVSASADGQAPFVVLVYVNDVMVKQVSVPAQ